MSSKTFLTIPKDQCLEVANEILLNSKTKWNSGKKLAILNDYGGATSYLIISTEELIKAMILFFDGKGFDFRNVKGMDVFSKIMESGKTDTPQYAIGIKRIEAIVGLMNLTWNMFRKLQIA